MGSKAFHQAECTLIDFFLMNQLCYTRQSKSFQLFVINLILALYHINMINVYFHKHLTFKLIELCLPNAFLVCCLLINLNDG